MDLRSVLHKVREFLPAGGLGGLLVPVIQFLWKMYRERAPEQRKRALRQEVTELQKFLESIKYAEDSPETEASRLVAQKELAGKLAAIAALSGHPATAVPKSAELPISPPTPVLAPGAPLAAPATLASRQANADWFRRWFLLYSPSRAFAWVPHALFFVSLTSLVLTIPVALSGIGHDPALATAPLVWLGLTLLFRAWAAYFESSGQSAVLRWFLLYPPRRAIGWLPRVGFFICLLGTVSVMFVIPEIGISESLRDSESASTLAFTFVMMLGLTMAFHTWGAAMDRNPDEAPTEPGRFRRALLLYVPSRPAVAILHCLFFLGPFVFFVALDNYFLSPTELVLDESGHSMQAFLALPLGYIVLLILLIRDWAAIYGPNGAGARKRMRWLFLGMPARLVGWIPRMLYYLAGSLLPLALFQLFEDHEHGGLSLTGPIHDLTEVVWFVAPIVGIVISSRRWARGIDAPGAPTASTSFWARARVILVGANGSDPELWLARAAVCFAAVLAVLGAPEAGSTPQKLIMAGTLLVPTTGWLATFSYGNRNHSHEAKAGVTSESPSSHLM